MAQCERHLSREEPCLALFEALHCDQVSEQFPTLDELHEEVNSELILEDVLHVYEEGVVNGIQDVFFQLDVFHLLVLNDDVLADALHSVQFPRSGHLLHQEHFTEGAFSDHFQNFEVVKLSRAVLASCVKLLSTQHGTFDFVIFAV